MVRIWAFLPLLFGMSFGGDLEIWNGIFYQQQGLYDDALFFYNKHLQVEPNDPGALFASGRCLFHKGDYRKAAEAFARTKQVLHDRRLAIDSSYLGLEYYSAKCRLELGDVDKRVVLGIQNSQDTLLAEALYLVSYAMDYLFFADMKKTKLQYSDEAVMRQYERVLSVYPEHAEAITRIMEIRAGGR